MVFGSTVMLGGGRSCLVRQGYLCSFRSFGGEGSKKGVQEVKASLPFYGML